MNPDPNGAASNPPTSSRRRAWLWTLLAIVIVVAAIVWLGLHAAHSGSQSSGPGGPPGGGAPGSDGKNAKAGSGKHGGGRPLSVGVATVARSDIKVYLNQLGTVTSLATATVHSQIAGQLMEIRFKEGQIVKAGMPLALIDPRPYQAQLAQYQGALQHDRALLDTARTDLARYQTLIAQESTSQQIYDTQVGLVKQYEGTVKSDEGQVAAAQLDLSYCNVVSPISGRVGLRQVDLGNYVTTGDTNGLVIVTQLSPISVVFTVPEDDIPMLNTAMSGGKPLRVEALDRAMVTHLADGSVSVLDNQIDTTTGTVKLRAQLPNTDDALFPNQFVNVKLLVQTIDKALVVPTSAIERGTQGSFVYVVQPDHTAAMKIVKLGPTEGERVVVESGVNEGDQVVDDGADQLKDGQAVIIAGAATSSKKGKHAEGQAGAPPAASATGPDSGSH